MANGQGRVDDRRANAVEISRVWAHKKLDDMLEEMSRPGVYGSLNLELRAEDGVIRIGANTVEKTHRF